MVEIKDIMIVIMYSKIDKFDKFDFKKIIICMLGTALVNLAYTICTS